MAGTRQHAQQGLRRSRRYRVEKGDLAAATKAKEQEVANREALAAVQALLPATTDAQGVIRQLTQLATTSGVDWQNVSLTKPAATAVAGLQAAPITIAIKGPMANIQAYLANVRAAAVGRIITVDTVSTSSAVDEATKAEVVTATVSLKAFSYVVDPVTITSTPRWRRRPRRPQRPPATCP